MTRRGTTLWHGRDLLPLLQAATSVPVLCERVAQEMQRLTGGRWSYRLDRRRGAPRCPRARGPVAARPEAAKVNGLEVRH